MIRNSEGEMAQRYDSPGSPLLAPPTTAFGAAPSHDAASSISDSGPFSGADAAIMADAFRKMLRKPDFLSSRPVEEGDSPPDNPADPVLGAELEQEGRDLRHVGSSRPVMVEGRPPGDPPL